MSGIDPIIRSKFDKEMGLEEGDVRINITKEDGFIHEVNKSDKFSKERFFTKNEAPKIYDKKSEQIKPSRTNKFDEEKVNWEEENKKGTDNEKVEKNIDLGNKFEKEGF